MIARRLESPNRNRGHHWSVRHRERNAWEFEIMAAAPAGWRAWTVVEREELRRGRDGHFRIKEHRRQERRRVSIVREVPSRRNFCRDDDNRAFTVKPVYDALKTLGLIFDDSSAWVVRELREAVGGDRTIVRIAREP